MNTAEMLIIRTIQKKTSLNRVTNEELRRNAGVEGIVRFAMFRRKERHRHTDQMEDHGMEKLAC